MTISMLGPTVERLTEIIGETDKLRRKLKRLRIEAKEVQERIDETIAKQSSTPKRSAMIAAEHRLKNIQAKIKSCNSKLFALHKEQRQLAAEVDQNA